MNMSTALKKDQKAYWVPFRVKGKRWIKTGPFASSDEARRERLAMKAPDCEVDIYYLRTEAEMEKLIRGWNGEGK